MDDAALHQAQESLGRALDRARAGEDLALAAVVREEGERLVKLLNGVLGMARLHAMDNHAFDQPIRDLEATVGRLIRLLGALHLLAVEDQIYLNDIRIRLEGSEAAHDLGDKLRRHQVGGISIETALGDAQLRHLSACLNASPSTNRPRAALQAALLAADLSGVELMGIHRFRVSGEKEPAVVHSPVAAATHAAALVDESWNNLAASRLPNPLPLRRAITEMLGTGGDDALGDEPDGSSPYAAHTLRVARLALRLGRALGLPEGALQDLGVAAMFHDIGYAAREGAETRGGVKVAGYAPPFERHPTAGARLILRQRGFHEAKVRRALATLDHHRRFDDPLGRPSLFGRILCIVEDYDNRVRPRGGDQDPANVLSVMAAQAGSVYDPVLLQLFVNALGRYPPGARLTLKDGRVVRVVSPCRTPETFDRPLVRVERLADGSVPADGVVIDLSQEGEIASAAKSNAATTAPTAAPSAPAPTAETTTLEAPLAEGPETTSAAAGLEPLAPPELGGGRHQLYEGVLPEVLREMYVGHKTGVLTLKRGDERRSLRFWKGHIVYGESSVRSEHMGEVAVREGLLSAEDLAHASGVAVVDKLRLGEALMRLRIMTEAQVEELIALHAREVLTRAFPWRDGTYDFERRTAEASWFGEMTLRLSTADLILEAVRRVEAPDIVRFHLGNLDLVLVQGDTVHATPPALTPLDGFILSRVDGTLTAREIIRITPHDAADVQRSLFGLLCTGLVRHAGSPKRHL